MLPASDFAIIGKDSLYATCNQNHIGEEEGKELIAREYGYKKEQLCFVEQPAYHIDLMILLLGGNKVLVKKENKKINNEKTIEDLNRFSNPPLNVVVDEGQIAGKQNGAGKWDHNFFNGEYVKDNEGKNCYITNGCDDSTAKANFEEYLKAHNPSIDKVIFSDVLNVQALNSSGGGTGCRFKGMS